MSHFLGLDVGTSGVRAILIDHCGQILGASRSPLPASFKQSGMLCQHANDWWHAVEDCLQQLGTEHNLSSLQALSIDGTSGTTLLTDAKNRPVSPALMYNDVRPASLAKELFSNAPAVPACSQTSALIKAVWLYRNYPSSETFFIQQQADWILSQFSEQPAISDWNNALKLGFDTQALNWPDWLSEFELGRGQFPRVFQPGKPVAKISSGIARKLGLPPSVQLHAGTTDSIAAFIASGACNPGDAVTSLGSTMVLKLCTHTPVSSNRHGIYSHRLDQQRWLAGGASNSGGAVLRANFSDDELISLSKQIHPDQESGLHYYPLPSTGERFPYPDPDKKSLMQPVPENRSVYLQAILEGIARIEKQGYNLLEELSDENVLSIRSCGRGATNTAWTHIRERIIRRPLIPARETEAAYGSALLAAGRL